MSLAVCFNGNGTHSRQDLVLSIPGPAIQSGLQGIPDMPLHSQRGLQQEIESVSSCLLSFRMIVDTDREPEFIPSRHGIHTVQTT